MYKYNGGMPANRPAIIQYSFTQFRQVIVKNYYTWKNVEVFIYDDIQIFRIIHQYDKNYGYGQL